MAYNKDRDRFVVKFNGGNGAVLCSNCSRIITNGFGITMEEYKTNSPVFCCETCREEWNKTKIKH